jgi:hypothetical protein
MGIAEVNTAIELNVTDGIKKVTGDDGSTEMFTPEEQLAGAGRIASQAAVKGKNLGIRMMKVRNGNALGQS